MIRFFDLLFSGFGMLVLTPILLPVMIALKMTGEHYVFYLQKRVGKEYKEFNVYKFATMLKESPSLPGGFITQDRDPRILPLGHFLRKTKINELPQLLNIFLGKMSFVGPRPVVKEHLYLYSPEDRDAIMRLRPGLTGVASLLFSQEEYLLSRMPGERKHNHDMVIAPYKSKLERWYLENSSIGLYFTMILLTIWRVVMPNSHLFRKIFKDLPTPPNELREFIDI